MTSPCYRILVVDDNEADSGLVERHLRRVNSFGVTVIRAASHEEGLRILCEQSVDCVVLDYRLGSECGLNTLKAIRGRGDDTAVVFVTGHGNEMVAVEALKMGAQDYLVKSVLAPEVLQRAILNAVEKVALGKQIAEKRRELEDFVSVVAHDLQQPLCAVKGNIELIRDFYDGSLDAQALEFVDAAIRTSARMADMLEALLRYARAGRDGAQAAATELSPVLAGVKSDLADLIARHGAEVEIEPLPSVNGDPVSLAQLFQNLIANAIKFRSEAAPRVVIGGEKRDELVRVWVRDNGIGIPSDSLETVFAPFRRLPEAKDRPGSGIGLATCKRIAEQHGGRIWVASEQGVGSTFFVTLRSSSDSAQIEAASGQARVLLVDAESERVHELARRMARSGMLLEPVVGVQQARHRVARVRFDAIIIDLELYDGDGLDFIHYVRKEAPRTALLAVTAGNGRCGPGPMLAEALRRGADHALPKPLEPNRVVALLGRMIDEADASAA